jgi:2-polyprenyl-3-methyl-5-hydroxy-6-metoxy-1,4-benzoquinol methylase
MDLISPLTKRKNVQLIHSVNVNELIKEYREKLNVDIRYLLKNHKRIELYRCKETGYSFYHPGDISGDDSFYEILGMNEWYYMDWKWEFEQSLKYINKYDSVLDIGSGKGDFLKYLKSKEIKGTGLEINKNQIEFCKETGLQIFNESVENHSKDKTNKYDIICSFQILEHIYNVRSYIESCINLLKPSGKLIISVPNNRSYLKYSKEILNMPPHHMGLWDEHSLVSLTKIFKLEMIDMEYEPLDITHKWQLINSISLYYSKGKFNIFYKLLVRIIPLLIPFFFKKFKAFTILVVFLKKQ